MWFFYFGTQLFLLSLVLILFNVQLSSYLFIKRLKMTHDEVLVFFNAFWPRFTLSSIEVSLSFESTNNIDNLATKKFMQKNESMMKI